MHLRCVSRGGRPRCILDDVVTIVLDDGVTFLLDDGVSCVLDAVGGDWPS